MSILDQHGRRLQSSIKVDIPPGPLVETTLEETLAIRKWAELAQFELAQQVSRAAEDKMITKKHFLEIKHSAEVIVAYLAATVMTIDTMLQNAKESANAAA